MNSNQRSGLEDEPFFYQMGKDNLFIFWEGKCVKYLEEQEVEKVAGRLERSTPRESQLLMAKLTGDVGRGNERG